MLIRSIDREVGRRKGHGKEDDTLCRLVEREAMPALIGDVSGAGGLWRSAKRRPARDNRAMRSRGRFMRRTCIAIRVSVFIGTCDTTATVAPLGVGADRSHRLRP